MVNLSTPSILDIYMLAIVVLQDNMKSVESIEVSRHQTTLFLLRNLNFSRLVFLVY